MKEMPTIKQIVSATSKVSGIPAVVLLDSKNRARNVTRARHIAQYVARTVAYRSWREITAAFGQKHPSALTGAAKVELALQRGDADLKKDVSAVSKVVKKQEA